MDFNSRYKFNPQKDLLGKGGFSKVYKATDTLLDRTVALKFFTGSGAEKYQVLNEIKKVIKFEHPNLCKYYDVAVLESKNVIGESEVVEVGIMEYLDAGDFKTYVKNNPGHIDKLLTDVLRGLSYLHRKGIVHRDLKPQNIIIKMEDDEPVAKITDFGISKLIGADDNNSSALIGTIEYMAPEQFNPKKYGIGGKITTSLDLWSFGLLVYEALVHKPLFGSRSSGTSAEQVMRNILSEAYLAKTKSLPEKYRAIVDKCLVKYVAQRVQNALELIPLFDGEPGWPKNTGNVVPPVTDTEEDAPEYPDDATELLDNDAFEESDATQVINQIADSGPKEDNAHISKTEAGSEPDPLPYQQKEIPDNATQVFSPADNLSDNTTSQIEPGAVLQDDDATQLLDIDVRGQADEFSTAVIPLPQDPDPNVPPPAAPAPKIKFSSQEGKNAGNNESKPKKILLYAAVPIVLLVIFFAFWWLSRKSPGPVTIIAPVTDTSHAAPLLPVIPDLIAVKGGHFLMGNGSSDATDDELPQHEVTLSDFSIGKYEITVDQFRQFINETKYSTTAETEGKSYIYFNKDWKPEPGVNWRHDVTGKPMDSSVKNMPVIHVSWLDAVKYCGWLSGRTKKHFRLPTEAEWEYAARGGDNVKDFIYSGSDKIEDVAWSGKNAGNQLHPIGTKNANELKIHDMSGNVMEWCNDWYDENYYKANQALDPKGPAIGTTRVARGGSWFKKENRWFYNSFRAKFTPTTSGGQVGFRICEAKN